MNDVRVLGRYADTDTRQAPRRRPTTVEGRGRREIERGVVVVRIGLEKASYSADESSNAPTNQLFMETRQ